MTRPSGVDWRDHAACRAAGDPNAFSDPACFHDPVGARYALGHCSGCPVTGDCAAWAARDEFTGVAGGRIVRNGHPVGTQLERNIRRKGHAARHHGLDNMADLPAGYDPPLSEAAAWARRYADGDRCPSARAGHLLAHLVSYRPDPKQSAA